MAGDLKPSSPYGHLHLGCMVVVEEYEDGGADVCGEDEGVVYQVMPIGTQGHVGTTDFETIAPVCPEHVELIEMAMQIEGIA
jgi:hypothetical protein